MQDNFNNYTYQNQPPQQQGASGLAIAAMVCGIVGFVLQLFPCSIIAVVMGAIARKNPNDKTLATVGMVFGLVQICVMLLAVVVWVLYVVFVIFIAGAAAMGSM